MKIITKFMLTLAMLVVAVSGVKAEKVYADLTQYGDKWDGTDVTFSWTAPWGNQLGPNLTDIGIPKGDLRNYEKLVVVVDEMTNCDYFRVLVYSGDDTNHNNTFKVTKTGANEFTLSGGVDFLNNVTRICLSGSSNDDSHNSNWGTDAGSFKVSAVYLERPDIVYIEAAEVFEAPAGTKDIKDLTGYTKNEDWTNSVIYPKELAVQGAAFGNGEGSNESQHVDIEGYDYLCLEVTAATANSAGLRVWIWDDVTSSVVTLYAKPIADYATATWTEASKITGVGTYVTKVTGYKYLKGIKAANDWGSPSSTVSMAWVCKGEVPVAYVPTGKYALVGETPGSATLDDALADASATCYDATGVTGTGIGLVAENPNALFIANEGVLANSNNVIVGGTCANLVLTDQKPFKTPSAFTATNAEFTKTVSDAGYATMVIPFDAALPEGVLAYNITGSDGDKLVKEDAESIEANKPVMLKNNGTFKFTATNAAIAATPDGVVANGLLCGVYNTTVVPAEGYVLQSQDNGVNFYKAGETGVEVNAFRAYLADATTTRLFFNLDDDVTGISEAAVSSEAADSEIYNLNGQRVANAQKGLYIVGGKKVMVK